MSLKSTVTIDPAIRWLVQSTSQMNLLVLPQLQMIVIEHLFLSRVVIKDAKHVNFFLEPFGLVIIGDGIWGDQLCFHKIMILLPVGLMKLDLFAVCFLLPLSGI